MHMHMTCACTCTCHVHVVVHRRLLKIGMNFHTRIFFFSISVPLLASVPRFSSGRSAPNSPIFFFFDFRLTDSDGPSSCHRSGGEIIRLVEGGKNCLIDRLDAKKCLKQWLCHCSCPIILVFAHVRSPKASKARKQLQSRCVLRKPEE